MQSSIFIARFGLLNIPVKWYNIYCITEREVTHALLRIHLGGIREQKIKYYLCILEHTNIGRLLVISMSKSHRWGRASYHKNLQS